MLHCVTLPAVFLEQWVCFRRHRGVNWWRELCKSGDMDRNHTSIYLHLHILFIAKVVGPTQGTPQPVFSSFLRFTLPSGTWQTPGLSIPWCCLLTFFGCCLPYLLPLFILLCKMALARPDERETWPYHCSLRLFKVVRDLRVVQLTARSWHELPRW